MESAEIDSELSEIDVRIDQLRALYEQYFMGMERMEPQKPRQEVERRLKVLRKEQIRNTAQRFKFNVLVQRLNTMQQYWGRVVREIENGTFKRDLVKAAARFGEGALTGVAKKRAKELSKLAAAQAKRPAAVDDMMELGADDLIEDEELDETPTPPRPAPPTASTRGLLPADLPLIAASPSVAPTASTGGRSAPSAIVEAAASAVHAVDPEARHLAPTASSGDAPPPSRRAGLRWGSSDPSSSIRAAPLDVKRRVAELAAEMRKTKGHGDDGPAFGALDLDFDDAPSSRSAADPAPPPRAATPARSLPSPPVVRGLTARPAVPAAPPSSPITGSFGVLDMPFDSDATAPPLPSASSPGSPGSGIRAGAGRPQPQPRPLAPVPPPVARPRPDPATPVPAASDLGDQRMRQIYAKYVETKRAANESTAGVTYEKLAATLRAQADKLRAQHPMKAIDYDVVIKDGKTHIKPVLR